MSHQYGPIGVQAYPEAVGAQQNMALPLSANKQVELMERLKQLRAWQQRQQADLLRQQQEQLLRLRSEQQHERAQENSSISELWRDGRVGEGEEESVDQMLTLPESPCLASSTQNCYGPGLVERTECDDDVNDPGEIFDSRNSEKQSELSSRLEDEENTTSRHVSYVMVHVHVQCQGFPTH